MRSKAVSDVFVSAHGNIGMLARNSVHVGSGASNGTLSAAFDTRHVLCYTCNVNNVWRDHHG